MLGIMDNLVVSNPAQRICCMNIFSNVEEPEK